MDPLLSLRVTHLSTQFAGGGGQMQLILLSYVAGADTLNCLAKIGPRDFLAAKGAELAETFPIELLDALRDRAGISGAHAGMGGVGERISAHETVIQGLGRPADRTGHQDQIRQERIPRDVKTAIVTADVAQCAHAKQAMMRRAVA